MKPARIIALFGLAAIILGSASASAQKIRTYGDSDSSTGTTSGSSAGGGGQTGSYYIPGQPVPQQGQQGAQQQQQKSGEEGDTGGSYVTVFRRQGGQTDAELAKVLNLPLEKLYQGVIPGKRDSVEHLEEAKTEGDSDTSPNMLTWVGFMPEDARTRVFFQTARRANYELGSGDEPNSVTVTFYNTRVPARNFTRFIDTSFFERNVARIETKKLDRSTVRVTIKLRESERPSVNREGNYLYLDFTNRVDVEESS